MNDRDIEIIDAIAKKDRTAYKLLFEEYFERMVFFAEYFMLNRQEAEDIVQEFFLALWNRHEIPVIRISLRSYLFTQIRNRCLNRLKHLNVIDRHNEWLREALEYAEIPDVEMDETLLRRINAAIEELPHQARAIFRRCVIDGKKYREVAEEMGVSVNTVNTQMKRAFKSLRDRLGGNLLLFIISL